MAYPTGWYLLSPSRKLARGARRRVRAFGRDHVLFRDDSGQAHLMDGHCPHLGAALWQGKVRGQRLECPFHGWEFAGDGACAHIPYASRIPSGARVRSYPLHEEGGFLWLRHGSSDTPPPRIPELDEDTARVSFEHVIGCPQRAILENAVDPYHMRKVHLFPTERVEVLELEETETSLGGRFVYHGSALGRELQTEVAIRFVSPTIITGSWGMRGRVHWRFCTGTLPLDERRTTLWNSILIPRRRGLVIDAPKNLFYVLSMWMGTWQDSRIWRELEPEAQRVTIPEEGVLARFRRFYGRALPAEGDSRSAEAPRPRRRRAPESPVPSAPSPG